MARKIVFIKSLPPSASVRDRELQQADVRKHAATVSHHRNRPLRTPQSSPLNYNRPVSQWHFPDADNSLYPLTDDNEWEDADDTKIKESGKFHRIKDYAGTPSQPQAGRTSHHPLLTSLPDLQKSKARFRYQRKWRVFHSGSGITSSTHSGKGAEARDIEGVLETFETPDEKAELARLSEIWHRDFSGLIRNVNLVEPFYRSPHGNASSFYRGCEYFMDVILPNNAPVYTIFNVSNVYTQHTFDLTQKDHLLHAWLATMHLLRSATAPETSSSKDAWQHTGAALAQLRRAVANPNQTTDDYLIGSILFLALLARAYGDLPGFEVHKKNLALLVKRRGGLDSLGYNGLLKACILQWESAWIIDTTATVFAEDRPIAPPGYPERPLSPSIREKITAIPLGFQRLASSYLLPLDLIEILSRIAEHHIPTRRSALLKHWDPLWRPRKHTDFWEACSSLAIPGPNFNKFLCLTLLLHTANEFSPVRRAAKGMTVYAAPRMLLMKQIQMLEGLITKQIQRECYSWMWMVLIDSWSERGILTATGEVLLMRFRQQFSEITTWFQLDAVLSKFFYSADFKAACKVYWNLMLSNSAAPG